MWLPIAVPILSALALALTPRPRVVALANPLAAALGLAAAVALVFVPRTEGAVVGGFLRADALSLWLLLLGALVGLAACLRSTADPLPGNNKAERFRPAALQLLLGAHHLALLTDGPVPGWAALVLLLLAALPAMSISGAGAVAARRALFSCGTGLAAALFGSALLLATLPGAAAPAAFAQSELLGIGFAFALVGYGALIGLAPLGSWASATLRRGGGIVFVLLAGPALQVLMRTRAVLRAVPEAASPDDVLALFALASLGVAVLAGCRRRGARHRVAWSGMGHVGLALLGFAMNAPVAGLLHFSGTMLLLGAASRDAAHPPRQDAAGRGVVLAIAALAGLPPFALFASTLAIVSATARGVPWLLPPLVVGLLGLAAMLLFALPVSRTGRLSRRFGQPEGTAPPSRLAAAAPWLCLAAAALLGLTTPPLLLEAAAVAGG